MLTASFPTGEKSSWDLPKRSAASEMRPCDLNSPIASSMLLLINAGQALPHQEPYTKCNSFQKHRQPIKKHLHFRKCLFYMVSRSGLEPLTRRLKVDPQIKSRFFSIYWHLPTLTNN